MLKESSKLDAILRVINERRVIDANGYVSFKGLGVHQFSIAIRTYIKNDGSLPQVASNRILSEALFDKDIGPSIDYDSLKSALYRASNRYTALPLKSYHMLTSWSADLRHVIPKRQRIGECDIKIGSVTKKFSQTEAEEKAKNSLHISVPNSYMKLSTHVMARCEYSAYEKAAYQTDVARGLINLIINIKMGFRETFGGKREPVNLVLSGPLHTLHSPDGSTVGDTFWYEMQFVIPSKTSLNREQAEKVREEYVILLNRLRRSTLAEHGKKVLVGYCRALDNWDWDTAFLELWRALEIAVGSPISYDDIVRRASFLWKNHDIAVAVLEHLKERRNLYVHHAARHADAEGLLFQLKPFVEEMIVMCINNPHKLENVRQLLEFLDMPTRAEEIKDAFNRNKKKLVLLEKVAKFKN